jgi:DNA-binding XRE family transcriptional regulator
VIHARRVGIDAHTIRQIEEGEASELTFKAVASYARAVGQRLVIDLAKAS